MKILLTGTCSRLLIAMAEYMRHDCDEIGVLAPGVREIAAYEKHEATIQQNMGGKLLTHNLSPASPSAQRVYKACGFDAVVYVYGWDGSDNSDSDASSSMDMPFMDAAAASPVVMSASSERRQTLGMAASLMGLPPRSTMPRPAKCRHSR